MSQADTIPTTAADIIRSNEFQRGAAEARAGLPPRYDEMDFSWEYEWGRQFGIAAPRNLTARPSRRAIAIFETTIYFHGARS
jgi:hypothetical protein